jgi:hypothetical protein
MSVEWVKQLKQAKQELDDRQAKKALSTITALLSSLSSVRPSSDKDKKKINDLHYQSLLLSGLVHLRLHHQTLALKSYTDATQLQPDNPAGYKALHELHSSTRHDDAILALSPVLLPHMQQAPDAKRFAYLIQISQLQLNRGKWKEAQALLFPVIGLSPKEESIEDGPVVDGRLFLPPPFYRLCFALFLDLDDAEKAKELSVRVERQMKKLRDKREEEKVGREKAEAKRQREAKARGEKVTVQPVGKEEKERQAKAERDEEQDVTRKVTAKLNVG